MRSPGWPRLRYPTRLNAVSYGWLRPAIMALETAGRAISSHSFLRNLRNTCQMSRLNFQVTIYSGFFNLVTRYALLHWAASRCLCSGHHCKVRQARYHWTETGTIEFPSEANFIRELNCSRKLISHAYSLLEKSSGFRRLTSIFHEQSAVHPISNPC
jgi:hypothetical protein